MRLVSTLATWLLCVMAAHALSGLHTRLTPNQEACFGYEASRLSSERAVRVFVHYKLSSAKDGSAAYGVDVTAAVRGPAMVKLSDAKLTTKAVEDQFTFNAVMSGLHRVCFWMHNGAAVPELSLELTIVGENDQLSKTTLYDGTEVVHHIKLDDKDSGAQYGEMLAALQNQVEVSLLELEHLSAKNLEFEHTVESTYIRVITFTIINFVVASAICGWQVLTLKSFFIAKKVV